MCGYGFEENIDYIKVTQKKVTLNNEGKNRAYNEEDYIITIDMAKEICMLQKSEVGREHYIIKAIGAIRTPKRF